MAGAKGLNIVPISVKDRMPPYGKEVLVFCYAPPLKDHEGRACVDLGFIWNEWNLGVYLKRFSKPNGWKDSDYYERYSKDHWNNSWYDLAVTHWLPKPPPPMGLIV